MDTSPLFHFHLTLSSIINSIVIIIISMSSTVDFVSFQLSNGIRVNDWDDCRDGVNWGFNQDITVSDRASLELQLLALFDRLPKTNAEEAGDHEPLSKQAITHFYLSGDLMSTENRKVHVFIACVKGSAATVQLQHISFFGTSEPAELSLPIKAKDGEKIAPINAYAEFLLRHPQRARRLVVGSLNMMMMNSLVNQRAEVSPDEAPASWLAETEAELRAIIAKCPLYGGENYFCELYRNAVDAPGAPSSRILCVRPPAASA
jgi:hypothetical protein